MHVARAVSPSAMLVAVQYSVAKEELYLNAAESGKG